MLLVGMRNVHYLLRAMGKPSFIHIISGFGYPFASHGIFKPLSPTTAFSSFEISLVTIEGGAVNNNYKGQ